MCGRKTWLIWTSMCEDPECNCRLDHEKCFHIVQLRELKEVMELRNKNYAPSVRGYWSGTTQRSRSTQLREELSERIGKIILSITEAQTSFYLCIRGGLSDNITPEFVNKVTSELG